MKQLVSVTLKLTTGLAVAATLVVVDHFSSEPTATLSASGSGTIVASGTYSNSSGQTVGGWLELKVDQRATVNLTPVATVSVGGGTWTYGTKTDSNDYRHCWSFYYHPSRSHHASADMGSGEGLVRRYATPLHTAYAEPAPAPYDYTSTCKVYWGLD